MDTCVVTVTYGSRNAYLRATLDAARREGVAAAIVVDNGAHHDVAALAQTYGGWVSVVAMGRNRGSAAAFKAGIEAALTAGFDRLLLLDDDNVLADGALAALVAAFEATTESIGMKAVCALRRDHGETAVLKAVLGYGEHLKDSFCHFPVADLWCKLLWRLRRVDSAPTLPGLVRQPTAPYGGLMFDRQLIATIGLPDERFVLYQDDSEFTFRLSAMGGQLNLAPAARIHDAEASWNNARDNGSALTAWVTGPSQVRVYYALRNHVYWDLYGRGDLSAMYVVNMAIYVALLFVFSLCRGRVARFRLILTAIADGMTKRMGENDAFPLAS
jgi:GT2 family glycosyltransferase